MDFKIFQILLPVLLSTSFVFGQSADSSKIIHSTFDNYENLRKKQKESGIDTLIYLDLTFNYKVNIPKWLNLRETGSEKLFGGTLPAIDGIENAIMVTGFDKSKFKSFDEFTEIYLQGTIGQPAKFSKDHVWFGSNELIKINNGVKKKVFTFWRNHIYHSQFILLETKSAYLWIQFTSTQETYNKNISKFDEFMTGFKITNF